MEILVEQPLWSEYSLFGNPANTRVYGATRDRRDPPSSRFRLLFSLLFCTKRAFERLPAPVTWVPVILSRAEFRGPIAKVQPDGATNPSDQEQVKRIQGWRLQERRNRKRVREGCPEGFPTRRRTRPDSGSPRLTSRLGESFPPVGLGFQTRLYCLRLTSGTSLFCDIPVLGLSLLFICRHID